MPLGAVPFPFGKCKICQDKATGVHYGVATCEGCKGFFKRSIPKADKYKCYFGGQCDISPQTRNRCKACRFKLCLQFGMSVDAVKMGRIPKTEKEKALAEAGLGSSKDDCIDDDDVTWSNEPNSFQETSIESHHNIPPHFSGENMCAQGGLGLDKYLPTVVQAQDNTNNLRSQNHDNIQTSPVSSTCYSMSSQSKDIEINRRNFNSQSSWGHSSNSGYSDNEVGSESMLSYYNNTRGNNGHLISPESHSHPSRLPEQLCRKRSIDSFQGNFDHQSNSSSALQHPAMGCSPAKSLAQQYNPCPTDNRAQNRVKVEPNTEWPILPPNANSHFSSRVIEELVRQVLETPVSQIIQQRLDRLSSSDSSDVPLKALTLEDSQNDMNEMSAVHFDGRREEKRHEVLAKLSSHKGSPTGHSNSEMKKMEFDPQFDVHEVLTIDEDRIKKEVPDSIDQHTDNGLMVQYTDNRPMVQHMHNAPVAQHTDNGPMVQHSEKAPLFQRTDNGPMVQHTDNGPMVQHADNKPIVQHTENGSLVPNILDTGETDQHTDRTVEEAQESSNFIDETMERLQEPIKYLFSYQAHNKECYRKHTSGECQVPFTTAEKSRLKHVWDQLMKGVQYYNNQLMGFCCKVPGFSNFKKEDQEKLTMNAYFEIWMMINAEFMCTQESYVLLNNQEIFYSRATMTVILGKELTDLMLDFSRKFCQFNLSDYEIGLLCAIRLSNPEVEDLQQKDKVELLNSHFLDIFASVLNKKQNSSRVAISLFQCLSSLKTLKTLQQEAIFNFNVEDPPADVINENTSVEDVDERAV